MNRTLFILTILTVAVLAVQTFFIDRLVLFGIRADIVLIPIAALAFQTGRMVGMGYGFLTGLIVDMSTGFLGVNALSKTIAGYLWGSFHTEGKPLNNWLPNQFLQVFAIGCVFHYLIYSGFMHLYLADSVWQFIIKYLGGQTLYTLLFAFLFRLYFWSRQR
ncbi:MAG: rod shape-determining protein MreD [Bacteroidetes bacterium]|nr:rod shape-determining protein MreD [Bacteroidota bacterium]